MRYWALLGVIRLYKASFHLPWWPSCLDRGALINVEVPGCGKSVVLGPMGHK